MLSKCTKTRQFDAGCSPLKNTRVVGVQLAIEVSLLDPRTPLPWPHPWPHRCVFVSSACYIYSLTNYFIPYPCQTEIHDAILGRGGQVSISVLLKCDVSPDTQKLQSWFSKILRRAELEVFRIETAQFVLFQSDKRFLR